MPFVQEETRALARIVKIDEIKPIKKADRLEVAVVGGWECVVEKGMYQAGQMAVYFEIDSAVPLDHPVWGDFDKKYLTVKKDAENGDKEYAVIKTLRLRSVLSQGLLMQVKNIESLPALLKAASNAAKGQTETDITAELGLLKYVSPQEWKQYQARLGVTGGNANARGMNWWWRLRMWIIKGIIVNGLQEFPRGHVKSDEQRLQNIAGHYQDLVENNDDWEGSVKLDGESAMIYQDLDTSKIGLAQRNFSLRTDEVPYTWTQSARVYLSDWMRFVPRRLRGGACPFPRWQTHYDPKSVPLVKWMLDNGIVDRLKTLNEDLALRETCKHRSYVDFAHGKTIAIQGEMVGPSFNGGAEGFPVDTFFVYRAYGNGNYKFTPDQTRVLCEVLRLKYIPVDPKLERFKLPATWKELLKMADGQSALLADPKKLREGLVVKNHATGQSFKVISNKWLENQPLDEEEEIALETA
jgi:hypothetical protein